MNLSQSQHRALVKYCRATPHIFLLYFFGSRSAANFTKNSDYDFAVLFNSKSRVSLAELHLQLLGNLIAITDCDDVDLVLLNRCTHSLLKFNVVTTGQAIFERRTKGLQGMRLNYELSTMNEYFDFQIHQARYLESHS